MKFKLRTKLAFSYAFVALLLVAVISVITNVFLQKQFSEYVIRQSEAKNEEVVSLIKQQYNPDTGTWNSAAIENIGVNALEQGMIVKLNDVGGGAVWDATVHNNGLCNQMITQMAQNMESRYPNIKGGYEEKSYPLTNDSNNIGTIVIGYYGPFYYTENDSAFIDTLNRLLILAVIVSLGIALLIGTFMARRISNPVTKAIKVSEQISKGNYKGRIVEKSSTKEMNNLIETINNLAKALENQDMLRKRLTSDVAHELRTPLATLQSHLEAMIDGVWEPSAQRLKSCHEEILRINRLVGDLEKLAKFEGDNLTLDKTDFNIKDLAVHLLSNFETDFKNKSIETSLEGGSYTVYADKDKISQVLVNLLSNAVKYTSNGGSIAVRLSREKKWIHICVKDTGDGISEEDLPYIFERFYRADKSRNRITGGSGIGLAIVKAIVEAHNGKISVTSRTGEGSEFVVSLPVTE